MIINNVLDELKNENTGNIRMVFITKKGKTNNLSYQMYNVPIDIKIKECLYYFFKSKLEEYCDKELPEKKYQVINSDESDLYLYNLDDSAGAAKPNAFANDIFSRLSSYNDKDYTNMKCSSDKGETLIAYCVIFDKSSNITLSFYKKVLPTKVFQQKRDVFDMIANQEGIMSLVEKKEMYSIDMGFDFLCYNRTLLIFNKYYFEQIVNMNEEYHKKASDYIDKLDCINNIEVLKDKITNNSVLQKRIVLISTLGIADHIEENSKRIKDVCDKHNLNIQYNNGKFTIEDNKKSIDDLCKVLGDYYKTGDVSTMQYEIYSSQKE